MQDTKTHTEEDGIHTKCTVRELKALADLYLPDEKLYKAHFENLGEQTKLASLVAVITGKPLSVTITFSPDGDKIECSIPTEQMSILSDLDEKQILEAIQPQLLAKIKRQGRSPLASLLFDALRDSGKDAANAA